MHPETEGSFSLPQKPDHDDGSLNRHECAHCGMWFRLDDAKPAGPDKIRCPNCDWVIDLAP